MKDPDDGMGGDGSRDTLDEAWEDDSRDVGGPSWFSGKSHLHCSADRHMI
jgi:hypothetical protein